MNHVPCPNQQTAEHGQTSGSCDFFYQAAQQSLGEPLEALHQGKIRSVEFSGGHVICDAPRGNRVYLPGSFNPLHDGHKYTSGDQIMTADFVCLLVNVRQD